MIRNIFFLLTLVFIYSCGQAASNGQSFLSTGLDVRIDSCDSPDASINCSFINIPTSLSSVMQINSDKEPGEKLILSGKLLRADGKTPYPDVILYAYQTDSEGYYSKNGQEKGAQKWHGHLHGWCKTDRNGRYEIRTIRPSPYPNNKIPAHIHSAVKVPGKPSPYYITDFVFSDDSLINEQYRESIKGKTGGSGVIDLEKVGGIWMGQRDIILEP